MKFAASLGHSMTPTHDPEKRSLFSNRIMRSVRRLQRPLGVLTDARRCSTAIFLLAATGATSGQESSPAPTLTLELNALQASDKGCRLTFIVTNNLKAPLDKAAFEIALFNQAQVVDRITVLDFKDLPQGKTKVRRFDLGDTDCSKIARVLVNDATECSGAGVDPKACIRQLNPTTKSGVQFGS